MKSKDAREYIEDYRKDDGQLDEAGIIELILWAYDKGWTEALEDYHEEQKQLGRT